MIFRCFDLETHLLSYYFLIEALTWEVSMTNKWFLQKNFWGVAAEGVSEFFLFSFDLQNPGCWSNLMNWLFKKTLTSGGAEIVTEINVREK